MELIQQRRRNRPNKWAAWFRNDLEIFPGPDFRWNGAMHTEGSIIMGGASNRLQSYLISSTNSCYYTPEASEITTAENEEFQGQFVSGTLRDNNTNGSVIIHSYVKDAAPVTSGDSDTGSNVVFDSRRDSIKDGVNPSDIALNPIEIVVYDKSVARGNDPTNRSHRDPNWQNQYYARNEGNKPPRITNKNQITPYVDDTYRADDRYGPKPTYRYTSQQAEEYGGSVPNPIAVPSRIGDKITDTALQPYLTNNWGPSALLGLDGYWERRARQEGLRIIVGERLELGKPLDPAAGNTANNNRRNEFYQHRTLRDNLAAVQATAVYHYKAEGTTINASIPDPLTNRYSGQNDSGYQPIACLATTHHHGTPQTALRSIMFNQYSGIQGLPGGFQFFDFFTGRGTDGWEFTPPSFNAPAMQSAMQNLVAYAGDGVDGAFPPKQETGGTLIHPNPVTTRAGNFSNLARALSPQGNNSLADQSARHTAGCMLGMLAHSVNTLETVNYSSLSQLTSLNNALLSLTDNDNSNGEVRVQANGSDAGRIQVNRRNNNNPLSYRGGYLDANAYITALIDQNSWGLRPLQENPTNTNDQLARLARLIALKEQVKYDLNPQAYACSIPDNNNTRYLRDAFCLGDKRRGFVIGQQWLIPNNQERTLQVEDAPSYNFDLRPSDIGQDVYVAGVGRLRLVQYEALDANGTVQLNISNPVKIISVTLRNTTGSDVTVPVGASASFVLGTVANPTVAFPNNPTRNSTTVTNLRTNQVFSVGDIIEIRTPDSSQRREGRFIVTSFIPGSSGQPNSMNLVYLGHTERSGGGSTNIPTNSLIVGVFNTAIKYPALRAIFNPLGGTAVTPSAIAATPRANTTDFLTPTEAANGILLNNIRFPNRLNQIIDFDGNARNVAFLDNTLFNGREEMAVREMDIDLDLLRRSPIGGDTWLPMGGIVYAFREDAVREDGIARPAVSGQNWMNTNPSSPHDPTLRENGISTKPVDFFPDPMRRPYGFRLWNGTRLDRAGLPPEKNKLGMTFISDNPVYVQGEFNWHSTNGTTNESNRIEEFTQKLPGSFNVTQFYSNRTTRDTRFAVPATDTWRATEILADAITLTSSNFCNGSANDYFAEAYRNAIQQLAATSPENLATNYTQLTVNNNTYASQSSTVSNAGGVIYPTCQDSASLVPSFLNANRPSAELPNDSAIWLRENPFDPSSPIYVDRNGTSWLLNYQTGERIDRNGNPLTSYPTGNTGQANNPYNAYFTFTSGRSRNRAVETRMNLIIVSGTVPSRPNQSYGGLHNFPRFIEDWGGVNLWIHGSLMQLNFSTQGNAPFDQDQWEISPSSDAACRNVNTAFNCGAPTGEVIQYYSPPNRLWGYDVGILQVRETPIAERFAQEQLQPSEFYKELPANDPYVCQLRRAQRPAAWGGGQIDPTATAESC
ncbi:hypothetical protein [Thermosynechococcus sp. FA-CM-4201]